MSGPVWRVYENDAVSCEECLQETTRAMAEGTVIEGEFHPQRILCTDCYHERIHLIAKIA